MRTFLSLLVLLSGLLVARELMLEYNGSFRPTFHGAKIISEQEIAPLQELPALTAREGVAPIRDLPAHTVAILRDPPPLAARTPVNQLAEVLEQSIATVGEPPTVATQIPVAPAAAQVAERSLAIIGEPPPLSTWTTIAPIGEVSEQSIATVGGPPTLATRIPVAPATRVEEQSLAALDGPPPTVWMPVEPAKASVQSVASLNKPQLAAWIPVEPIAGASEQKLASMDGPPALFASISVGSVAKGSDENITSVHEPRAPVVRIAAVSEQSIAAIRPKTSCEQIWDQMTHMTKEEWAEACRRVDDENQAGGT